MGCRSSGNRSQVFQKEARVAEQPVNSHQKQSGRKETTMRTERRNGLPELFSVSKNFFQSSETSVSHSKQQEKKGFWFQSRDGNF